MPAIAETILGIIGELARDAWDAYQRSKADAAAVKQAMLDALDKARAKVETIDAQLRANDLAADALAEQLPPAPKP